MTELCGVPGCGQLREVEDCCTPHAQPDAGHSPVFAPNDGIIDWIAVELAAQGARRVPLTWVEFEIASALALVRGATHREVARRIGIESRNGGRARRRRGHIACIEAALRAGAEVG